MTAIDKPGDAPLPAPDNEALTAADLTAAAVEVIPPGIVAQSLGEYLRAWLARIRDGDAGVLPVALALVGVPVAFTVVSPNHVFLSPANLVNLFDQSAVFIVLAMGEGFVLLLGEIDLSIGYVAAIGGIVAADLVQPEPNWPWWPAIAAALVVCAAIGAIHGAIITRLGLPAFVVTLAGYLFWFGVMIIILGTAGGVSITSSDPATTSRRCTASSTATSTRWSRWIGLVVIVTVLAAPCGWRDARRRRSGLVAPPVGLTLAKIAPWRSPGSSSWRSATSTGATSCRSSACPGWSRSSCSCSASGRCCSSGPSSGGTCTPSAATPKRPVARGSTSRGSARSRSCCARSPPASPASSTVAAGWHDDQHQRRPARPVRRRRARSSAAPACSAAGAGRSTDCSAAWSSARSTTASTCSACPSSGS